MRTQKSVENVWDISVGRILEYLKFSLAAETVSTQF